MIRNTVLTPTVTQGTSKETLMSSGPSGDRVIPSKASAGIIRMQEKVKLQDLNDKLAKYIGKAHSLKLEISKLNTQIKTKDETNIRQENQMKGLYESELAKAKKVLDETARDKAAFQMEADKYKTEVKDWQARYHKRDKDAKTAEKRVLELQAEIGDVSAKLSDAGNNKKHAEGEVVRLHGDIATLERQITALKKQLEDETLLRVGLENKIKNMKEELARKDQLHKQELDAIKTETTAMCNENDLGFYEDYETKLQDALKALRKEQDEKMKMLKEDLQKYYDKKNDANDTNVKALQQKLRTEKEFYKQRLQESEKEVMNMRHQINQMMQDYTEVLNVNVRLQSEIEAYGKLMEVEEDSLSEEAHNVGRKRKRVTKASPEQSGSQAAYGYVPEASAKGAIEIHDTDHEGKFIELHNTGDEDIVLGGWHLKHVAGDKETAYKFHKNLKLKAHQFTTVWSSNAGQTHNPPKDLVMKGHQWFTTDEMKTSLYREDQEMATREMKRTMQPVGRTSGTYRDGDEVNVQKDKEAELLTATGHLQMAFDTVTEYRQDFEKAKGEAVYVCNKWNVNTSFKVKRSFKRKRHFDELTGKVPLDESEDRFRINVLMPFWILYFLN